MTLDPNSKEGQEHIRKIRKKLKAEGKEARRRAAENPDDEPYGKLTVPSELDLMRDRKDKDD